MILILSDIQIYTDFYSFPPKKRSRLAKKSNQIKSWKGWYLENKAIGKCIIANALEKISLAHPGWESEWMFRSSKALTSERKPFDIPTVSCLCASSHVEKDAAHERKSPCVLCAQVASRLCERSHGEGAATSWGRFSWVLIFIGLLACVSFLVQS